MANNDNTLDVKLIFVLGFNESINHIELLQRLVDAFGDEDVVETFATSNDVDEVEHLLLQITKGAH